MFQSDKNNNMSSILGPEIEVNGDLKIKGDILIYGTVLGNVECRGKVHTSKGSLIKGNVNSKSAYINGEVKGDLILQDKVVLAKLCICLFHNNTSHSLVNLYLSYKLLA